MMRTLFTMDSRDYDTSWPHITRPSVRGIIIRDGKIAMVESRLYHYWKFPGGGMEEGEGPHDTLIREVREEAGLRVIPSTIKEYGLVPRREASTVDKGTWFIQDNLYCICAVEDGTVAQELDQYEDEENFTLSWIDPETAIDDNMNKDHGPKSKNMIEREARVLMMLKDEGFFG